MNRTIGTLAVLLCWAGSALAQSTINPALPANGQPYSSSVVRGNFDSAYNDINALYLRSAAQVTTSAALAASATTTYPNGVWRTDYATGVGAGPLFFQPQTGTCAANSMANDGGNCVNAAGGNSWRARPPPSGESIKQFGADGTSAPDATAFTAAFALTDARRIIIPVGTFIIPCASAYVAASGIQLIGEDPNRSIIQLPAACTIGTSALFAWTDVSGGGAYSFTLDLNGATTGAYLTSALFVHASGASIDGFTAQGVRVVNSIAPTLFQMSVNAESGRDINNLRIAGNYFKSTPSTGTGGTGGNQCIGLTTNGGVGTITSPIIDSNVCDGAGVQIDGRGVQFTNNDIRAYQFGAGVYSAESTPFSCSGALISGNHIHDTTTGLDASGAGTPHLGIENHCPNSTISNNITNSLGGPGINNSANDVTIVGNAAFDNGSDTTYAGLQSGIALSATGGSGNDSENVYVAGNHVYDDVFGTNYVANGVSNSGQKVLTTTNTTSAAAGMVCIDASKPSALGSGNGDVVASVQAGVSLTMTNNLTAATVSGDRIACGTRQLYGIAIGATVGALTTPIKLDHNEAAGQIQAVLNNGVTSSSSIPLDPSAIFTRKIEDFSGAATSLDFTGLDTLSYKSWRLQCRNVSPNSAQVVGLQVGQGRTSPPTWKTAATYAVAASGSENGVAAFINSSTSTSILLSVSAVDATQAAGMLVDVQIGDLQYPGATRKTLQFQSAYLITGAGGGGNLHGFGYWEGDFNAVSAIRLIAGGAAPIKGSCVLEGRP